ncbi:extensin isoform X1 [Colossoma macropomum]|uniref:extensin isoform X1 n=2 Tax=Colossoma macropomum TaxID=42526 RepID=UPI0018656480|nr:extensin isoform X1 [Colossoma macropomum]XP_036432798.1 extensin isoform X1 [Colossoma macropomum]
MERGHDPVSRGVSWTGPGAMTLTEKARDEVISCVDSGDSTSPHGWEKEKEKHSWVKVKPALTSSSNRPARKTNLSRSASLSEKELKEARTRSQIIAAQLTVPSNTNSRGVQLFNRRRQRVNAFTLVSVGGGEGGHHQSRNEPDSPASGTLTWEHSTDSQSGDLNHRSSQILRPSIKGRDMEAEEVVCELGEVEDRAGDRHFVPVNEKDEDIAEESKDGGDSTAVLDRAGQEDVQLTVELKGPADAFKDIPNGCHSTEHNGQAAKPASKQPNIMNRTARPFFSPGAVTSAGSGSPAPDTPAPSYSTPPLSAPPDSDLRPPTHVDPPFPISSRPAFSPPPPAPSYPTPPLPTYMSPPPSVHSNPLPSAMSPPPAPVYYAPPTAPRPTFIPQFVSERRSVTPIRTGILDEGVVRRANRKSMFTFQEKPKLAPNPELLSLVQGADEMKRGRGQSEPPQQEEELLALGAEASNFLAKDEGGVEEAFVPEWASTLRSTRTRGRTEHKPEHKPEQALMDASGKGAELFTKRQTRMEKYVHENKAGVRSPSPTSSLPPSWVYPSNMPGRVKAIANSSNISAQIAKSLHTQQATNKKNVPAKVQAPAPPLVPESPALENGCSRVEMELSRHQPYQLNSSLFILSPTKDPIGTLPRAAPPPKPVLTGPSYPRQTSLPSSPITAQYSPSATYRSAHCFSPPVMPLSSSLASPVSGSAPERVASPRSTIQAPKPTYSAKKAGIAPQVKEESPTAAPSSRSSTPTPWTPNLSRRLSSPEGLHSAVWSPSSQRSTLVTSPPPRPIYNPATSSPTPRTIHNPISSSPTQKSIQSPVSSSSTPRPFHNPAPSTPFCRPTSNRTPTTPVSPPWESGCQSPISPQDTKANHRLLAKNIINAAKRKNSPSPGALSGHNLPMSPVSSSILPFEPKPASPFQSRSLGAQSPTFTSPPPTPTRMVRSPLRLYNTRSLTDSDASLESEDSGVRSPGARTYNTCPRGWTGSLRVKRGGVSEDL